MATIGASTLVQAGDVSTGDKRELTATRGGVGKFFSIDPAQVKVGGEIGRRIDVTIQTNLLVIETENQFLKPFRDKQSQRYAYVGLGKLIDASVSFARYSKDPKVLALKDRLVKELLATQQADGYLGTFPAGPGRLLEVFDEHEMAYNIHALVNNYRYFQDPPSLDAAHKLADYIVKNYKSAIANREPELVCKIDIERAFLALSEATGDARYRDYIVERESLRTWSIPPDVINEGLLRSGEGHAYTFMNNCMAQLDLYRVQPDEALLTQSQRLIAYLTRDDGMLIDGSCGKTERFTNIQDTRGETGESCATAYLIRVADGLLQLEGKTLYGDIMERAIYNALFAAQSPDGRSFRYYTAIDGPRKYYDRDTYCCPGNMRRILAELPEMIYYRSADGGVLINLYTASTADVPVAGNLIVRLRQETDYPNSGKVVIKVDPSRAAEFPLKLRIPRWCESAAVSVNGQPAGGPVKPGEWSSLKRSWKAGDVVTLEMPMKTRVVRGRKLQAGKVAAMRGPVVFCFSPARQAAQYPVEKIKIDWSTLTGPVPDTTLRPDGQALEVLAWGPDRLKQVLSLCPSRPTGPANLKIRLTEFVDPTGDQTYWPVNDPKAGVADELCEPFAPEMKEAKMEDMKNTVGTGAPHSVFTPGKVWLDDRGKPIESHLGGLLYEKGIYYWYGMNFDTESIKPGTVRGQIFSWMENRGVTCYSSRDLYNWKFETVSLLPTRDDPKAPLQPTHDICRPKVIKCDKTGKYVMMAQLFSIDLAVNCIVVGIADTPSGPFAYHGLLNPPDGGRDITLFKDDDGKAYLIRGYEWVKASVLSDDYLSIASTHDLQGVKGESPAIFKHEGTYYCLTSQLTGYAPNANKYSIAKQVLGPWEPKGEFCKGPEADKTFGGQTTFVLPVVGVPGAFIFLADRWNSKTEYITEHRDATHIWLPITVDAAAKTIQVPWRDTWDLAVFNQK